MVQSRSPLRVAAGKLVLSVGLAAAAAPAQAADLPLRGPLPAVEIGAPYDWTGFHIGIEAGWGRAGKQTLNTTGTTPQEQALIDLGGIGRVAFARSGVVAGGGIGYDLQLTPGSGFVVGLAADVLDTGLGRTRTTSFPYAGNIVDVTARQSLDWLGTVRGRLGYAFDRVLVYGTGGFAYGGLDLRAQTDLRGGFWNGPLDAGRHRGIETGFVYGGGVAFALPPGLGAGPFSVKVEYLRYDLGARTVPIEGTGPVFGPGGLMPAGHTGDARFETQGQLLKAGIDYRFSGAFD